MSKTLESLLPFLKIFVKQFQTYLEQQAAINNLPPPEPLPETWEGLLSEPSIPDNGGDDTG
ncbi:MAG: hypothetical protein AMS21_00900 [Gemmatimonas sp. SG8_38_2]|nr:MAG: hypothetical protein AMS21_00900 [Gemmatimonas sp. SG8_38_2]